MTLILVSFLFLFGFVIFVSVFISIPGNYLAYLTLILVFILENAFGRLTSVYRIFRKPIEQNVANIDRIVLACCSLHNFILHHRGLTWNVQSYQLTGVGKWTIDGEKT